MSVPGAGRAGGGRARGRAPGWRLSRRRAGVALVLVLVVMLLLGLAGLSLAFTVALDNLAARNVQQAALAEGEVEGALQLAAAEIGDRASAPVGTSWRAGPWPALARSGSVTVVVVAPGRMVLSASAAVGRSRASRTVTLQVGPGTALRVVRRP